MKKFNCIKYSKNATKSFRLLICIVVFSVYLLVENFSYVHHNSNNGQKIGQMEFDAYKIQSKSELDLFKAKIVRPKYNVDCKKILELNKTEINRAKKILKYLKSETNKIRLVDDANYIFPKRMCEAYRNIRLGDRVKREQSPIESGLPLAYSILIHRNVEELERLLTVLYAPSNVYCIHVDAKATATAKKAVESIVNCYDNVFVATQSESVVHSGFSLLKADINCLSDLFYLDTRINQHENLRGKRFVDWKYFINLPSTEFPLRTNSELTRILSIYNGSSEIEIVKNSLSILEMWLRVHLVYTEDKENNFIYPKLKLKSQPPPHGYKIFKGYGHVVLSRAFVKYALEDPKARDLLEWGKDTFMPDEWYWATLQYNIKHFPQGGFKVTENESKIKTLSRYSAWKWLDSTDYDCKGIYRNLICLLSIEDLHYVIGLKHFFVNKFYLENDPIAYQCMEEWYLEREASNQTMNMKFYCDWIKKHSSIADCT